METIWMEHALGDPRHPTWQPDSGSGSRPTRRRWFWCAERRREVEVEFEEGGLAGFRRAVAVRSCPIFDPPTAIACRRRCLDAQFRRQWDSPLPVRMKAGK